MNRPTPPLRIVGCWLLSTPGFTVRLTTDDNQRIVEAAPIVREFKGQSIHNLIDWCWQRWPINQVWMEPLEET